MKTKRFKLFLAAVLLFSLGLHAREQFTRFVSKENGFSIAFPKDWEQKKGYAGTVIAAVRPTTGLNDNFRENGNVVSSPVPKSLTLKHYVDFNLATAQKQLTQYNQIKRGKTTLGGSPAEWITYTFKPGTFTMEALVYIATRGNRGYVITFVSLPDRFNQWQKTFEQITRTFKFI